MIKFNLARNCLKYIIRAYGIKEIFVPYYSCNSVWKALREEDCRLHFYNIDNHFEPIQKLPEDAYILYINYFGLCEDICKKLSYIYPNLIIDNTQSFYSKPIGLASFNSLRKFFKVQNGAYLHINKLIDCEFSTDNLTIDVVLMHENYEKFVQNELLLNHQEIKYISPIVEKQMRNIDFNKDTKQRIKLFKKYSEIFSKYNNLSFSLNCQVPYCYPFQSNNEYILDKLADFTLLKLWDKDNIIALPLNDSEYAKKIISAFST